ncbi:hypothetical protein WG906_09665 [Pedobacter sp. P351]|uniref:hypothetical protein n=1 Tax=Pedobacter superstes TaxID=3133441 RepID=UPI0030B301B1
MSKKFSCSPVLRPESFGFSIQESAESWVFLVNYCLLIWELILIPFLIFKEAEMPASDRFTSGVFSKKNSVVLARVR